MNNTIKKVFGTGIVLTLVGVVGFGTAFGYGGSSGSRRVTPVVAPVVTPVAGQVLGAESFVFTKRLANKSQGEEVSQLQTILNTKGFGPLVVDGKFGPLTKTALIKFQIANGLVGDGIVGPLTRAALNK